MASGANGLPQQQHGSDGKSRKTSNKTARARGPSGLPIERRFTAPGVDPLDQVTYERRSSAITNPDGSIVFQMDGAEIPTGWSQLAADIVISKYFRKAGLNNDKDQGEKSVRQVVHRLAHTLRTEGEKFEGYFATKADADAFEAELSYLLVNQYGAFNSPVWFNLGLYHDYGITGQGGNWAWMFGPEFVEQTRTAYERPQCSACFIQSVPDDLMGIYDLMKSEARLFKYGSGTGSNFSAIRGKQEKLSGGGFSSGLLSFLEVFDRAAGSTKSGGTTRRAAKMVCLDMDHPEIVDFITWKMREEKKAHALIAAGYPSDFNGEAYHTISGQNSNNSVRVSDQFMTAVQSGASWSTRARTTGEIVETFEATNLWRQLAEAAWACADPGVQYDTTINRWHTCPNTQRINASNPCQPAWATMLKKDGIRTLGEVHEGDVIWSGGRWTKVVKKWSTGIKPVFKYRTTAGSFVGTETHRVVSHGDKVEVRQAETIDACQGPRQEHYVDISDVFLRLRSHVLDGFAMGTGRYVPQQGIVVQVGAIDRDCFEKAFGAPGRPGRATFVGNASSFHADDIMCVGAAMYRVESRLTEQDLPPGPARRTIPEQYWRGSVDEVRGFLRGLYSANGWVIANRVVLRGSQHTVSRVQEMLSFLGIESNCTTRISRHDDECATMEYELSISSDRKRFRDLIGFLQASKQMRLDEACAASTNETHAKRSHEIIEVTRIGEEEVFDLTVEDDEHTYWTGGLLVSNCSEYMFLDDTACNLASVNLTKFLKVDAGIPGQGFDVEGYRHACRMFFIAQEILVDVSSYPTEPIAKNSHDYRPLGLGYANLGSLLMSWGVPYDSDNGRAIAGALTAIMCGTAYKTSAEMAATKGPFAGFAKNREPMLKVMRMHLDETRAIQAGTGRLQDDVIGLALAAREDWKEAVRLGTEHGYRNAQATVLAPTGTIGLLMDCDTTGVEPDFALVKFKKLAGGGHFKIVNQTVPAALRRLRYSEQDVNDIVAYISGTNSLAEPSDPRMPAPGRITRQTLKDKGLTDAEIGKAEAALPGVFDLDSAFASWVLGAETYARLGAPKDSKKLLEHIGFTRAQIDEAAATILGRMTIEGAPHLRPEDYEVFDCANRCGKTGKRFLAPMSHVRMMAAVQPFLSGAISKTVNLPSESTVEEVAAIYEMGWRLGLKAVALYRDGCKASQPLSTGGEKKEEKTSEMLAPMPATAQPTEPQLSLKIAPPGTRNYGERARLPTRRRGFTQEARIGNHKIYIRTGEYEDGSLGEIFIDMHKEGAAFRSVMNCLAMAVSLGLQYGVPLSKLVEQFTFTRFEPSGPVQGHPYVKFATSLVDYIFRTLGIEYLHRHDLAHIKPEIEAEGPTGLGVPRKEPSREPDSLSLQLPAAQAAEARARPESAMDAQLDGMMGDAPVCDHCGHITVRNGACYRCLNCGNSMGCS